MNEPLLTDEQCVRRVFQNEPDAFALLVQKYQTVLLRYFHQRHTREDSLDLLQETFCEAWRSLRRYDTRRSFSTWLFTIAYRQSVRFFRTRLNRPDFRAEACSEVLESIPAQDVSGKTENGGEENLWTLARRVLNEPQWTALWLFYAEDKPVRDIAQIMGRTTIGVRTLLFRGRKKLREVLT
ncbi:MAG: sigma-70 family RNA polymerase sigma factor [Planctomycetia bacterium]|nr:sigma-70 family RNA polymerase sigma factor [Planctomycetia bacterium]